MAAGLIHHAHEAGINAIFGKEIPEHQAVFADHARMGDISARLCQRNGLIQALAAYAAAEGGGRKGFARTDEMGHLVYQIEIQRTKVQNLHGYIRSFHTRETAVHAVFCHIYYL